MQDAWFEEVCSKIHRDPTKFLPENLSPPLLKEYLTKFSNFQLMRLSYL